MKDEYDFYINEINKGLLKLVIEIKKHLNIKFTETEYNFIKSQIDELINLLREFENSGIVEEMPNNKKYLVGKAFGRLEAIYSIIYPLRK